MTATIHTPLPDGDEGHVGERQFAEQLAKICGPQFHLWFSLDYLPGVTDLDLLVCEESAGFFAVEVKAVPLSAVTDYSAARMAIAGRQSDRHPLKQARHAQLKLVEYLKAIRVNPPFIYTTAAFPKISRRDFLDRFGGVPAIALQAEGMLFSEDLVDGVALSDRLRHVTSHPPFGAAPRQVRPPSPDVVKKVIDAVDPRGKPAPSPADVARAAVLRAPVRRSKGREARIAEFLTPGQREPVVFRGYPGTGKTFVLLRIALEHARAGRSVLFACFNKVLASDIRRMLSTTNIPTDVTSRIDVVQVWALRGRYSTEYVDGDHGALAELAALRGEQDPLSEYDTVCIDEAQDLPEFAFRLIDWHTNPGAEWFLAHGPGQELYGTEVAPFMTDLLASAEKDKRIEQLNRVYRTAHVDFLVAQGVFELSPHVDRVREWVTKRPLPQPKSTAPDRDDQAALFDKPLDVAFEAEGQLPQVVVVPQWRPELAADDRTLRRDALQRALVKELSSAADEGRPGDVAILLRNVSDRRDAEDARAVLDRLDVPYVDQIDASNRDLLLPAGYVRLVSFKSARGIEAHRTILVGFDDLRADSPAALRDSRNQAYIALSRAKASTTVLTRPHLRHEFGDFLEALVKEYTEAAATRKQQVPLTSTALQAGGPPHDEAWSQGVIDRVVEDGGYGFIRAGDGKDVFFHMSSLLGMDLEDSEGRDVWFTSVEADRGDQATVVAGELPTRANLAAQPGCEPGYVSMPIGDRGFGFLVTPRLTKRVFFHVNQTTGSGPLTTGERVDVMLDNGDSDKPRAVLVVSRT